MKEKIDLLTQKVISLIDEVQSLRTENAELRSKIDAANNNLGLTKEDTLNLVKRIDSIIEKIETNKK